MMPEKFYLPWAEIDPALKHGGIPGMLEEHFVGPDLGDNPTTKNRDLYYVFGVARDACASLAMRPAGDLEGPPNQNALEEVLKAMNWYFERVLDRTKVCSTAEHEWRHAIPPVETFKLRPIKYPLRSEFMDNVIFYWLGTLVEIAELNRNGNHSYLDPSSSLTVLSPLYHLKKTIIKDWFDQEVAGELSLAELQGLFKDITQPGPTIVPAGESMPLPDGGEVKTALTGVDTLQWYPQETHWAIFGKKQTEMYKPERLWQPEGAISATEDVASEDTTPASTTITPG